MYKWNPSRQLSLAAAAALLVLLPGCDRGDTPSEPETAQMELSPAEEQQLAQVSRAAWRSAEPAIEQSLDSAQQLNQQIDALLREPAPQTLAAAQDQWLELASAFQPLHVYGSAAQLQPEVLQPLRRLLFDLAAQPILPGYLDNVGPYAHSGIVHDFALPITAENLRHQHGATDEEEVALGLYALQFMLFGVEPHSPRQAADYAEQDLTAEDIEQGYGTADELPNNRRRQLIRTQVQLLLEDLQRLRALWQTDTQPVLTDAFLNLDALQRHSLFLRSLQLELLDLSAAVESLNRQPTETEQTADPAAPMAWALEMPELAQARAQFLLQLAQVLELDEGLTEQLEQIAQGIEQMQRDSGATAEARSVAATTVTDSLTQALEQVTRALRVYAPASVLPEAPEPVSTTAPLSE